MQQASENMFLKGEREAQRDDGMEKKEYGIAYVHCVRGSLNLRNNKGNVINALNILLGD